MIETIGLQLKQARENKNLTIQKVVQAIHLRAHFIEALEADDFDSLPSPIQARAFLKIYAEFLGISLEDAIAKQLEGMEGRPVREVKAFPTSDQPAISTNTAGGYFEQSKSKQNSHKASKFLYLNNNSLYKHIKQSRKEAHSEISEMQDRHQSKNVGETASPVEIPDTKIEPLPSQLIFNSIGRTLRQRRESLSLTLEEIERHTRVPKHYLLALEAGNFMSLPSSVQARGMLANYAHFLDLDVDAILLSFADGLQVQLSERQVKLAIEAKYKASKFPFVKILPNRVRTFLKRYISVDILVGGGMVLILLTFAIWGTNRILNMRAGSTPQVTAPAILSILQVPTEIETITPETETTGNGPSDIAIAVNTLPVTVPAAGNGAVQVVVIAQNSAYVRVTVDGKVQFEGRITAGAVYPFDGSFQIEVLTGNGRAVNILYNQNNLGPMGDIGQVVDRIYTKTAILNPTATFTPTSTVTPTPTITLRPSATPRLSITPRASVTPHPSSTPQE